MWIDAHFDGGNITVIDAHDRNDVQLAVRDDAGGEHRQWFSFRVSSTPDASLIGAPLCLRIMNAGECSYPKGWDGYTVAMSTDQEAWRRVPETEYADGVLTIRCVPDADVMWFAYFAPYPLARHDRLIARCQRAPGVTAQRLGSTLDGRALDLLRVGAGPADAAPGARRTLWLIARQHPGETMAEWWMEGFLERLLDPADALARWIRAHADLYIVPNMNPDGSARGHLRTNACGANLNREWDTPTAERSPEVRAVRDHMDRTGVDFCLDVHGDEALPYNFIAGAEGIVGWTDRLDTLTEAFKAAYQQATPDFQTTYGYPRSAPGSANMSMCTTQIAQRFDCLSMTLEMPFKDAANMPDAAVGWSPARAKALGAAALDPIAQVLPTLR